jgi:hypothetical protein
MLDELHLPLMAFETDLKTVVALENVSACSEG